MTPAKAASAAPRQNTSVNSCETLMPQTRAICGSSTPARIMAPSRVQSTMIQSAIATTTATAKHRQPIEREEHAHRLHRAAQFARRRRLPGVAGPDHQAEVGDDEGEAERQQDLRQHLAFEAAQEEALDDAADHGHRETAEQRREPEVHAPVQERHAEIGARA